MSAAHPEYFTAVTASVKRPLLLSAGPDCTAAEAARLMRVERLDLRCSGGLMARTEVSSRVQWLTRASSALLWSLVGGDRPMH